MTGRRKWTDTDTNSLIHLVSCIEDSFKYTKTLFDGREHNAALILIFSRLRSIHRKLQNLQEQCDEI